VRKHVSNHIFQRLAELVQLFRKVVILGSFVPNLILPAFERKFYTALFSRKKQFLPVIDDGARVRLFFFFQLVGHSSSFFKSNQQINCQIKFPVWSAQSNRKGVYCVVVV
jgi:hypothetical protein